MFRLSGLVPVVVVASVAVGIAHGQTLTTLASFSGSNGANPMAGLTLSGSTLYGTTYYGGAYGYGAGEYGYGTVFSVPVSGGGPTVLASFNASNGDCPRAGLTLSGTTLYGTTYSGGEYGQGTLFSVPVSGGSPAVLATFNEYDFGDFPVAGLTLIGNTLYGTTTFGGAYGNGGTVFSFPVSGGSATLLASFNGVDGEDPVAGLTLIGNTLYGTAIDGGPGYGTVFSVPVSGGSPTVLASFNGGSNGNGPAAGLTLSADGSTLYGTTYEGGAYGYASGTFPYGYGTVFSVPVSGGSPTVLASFNGGNGELPEAALTLIGNTLFGTTYQGGAYGDGTVFSVPVNGGSPTVLASFNGSDGANPLAGLTLSGNTLYGTTYGGGANNDGTVFALTVPEPPVLTLLGTGAGCLFGFVWRRRRKGIYMLRLSGLVLALVVGLVAVEVAHAQTLTTLVSFNGSNGENPIGGVTLIGSTLYGTAGGGGAYGDGAVFSVPVGGGSPTVLGSFDVSNGCAPQAGLTLIGNTLYGTTYVGGEYDYGTVFSVPVSGGSPTVLASFDGSNGDGPYAGLTLIGNALYGTTWSGGAYADGMVFSVPVSGGSPTVLASFNGSDGAYPEAGLTRSGNTLYGTTYHGGANDAGTVFSVPVTGGSPTVLASFNGSDGASPVAAALTLGADGNTLYGTTAGGGAYGWGTVFRLPVSGGGPTVLASFDGSNGECPYGGLTLSGNSLYGTTEWGGEIGLNNGEGYGTVFALTVPEPSTIALLLASIACLLPFVWR